jgi:transcriptional regulator with XRE-family HTH domain
MNASGGNSIGQRMREVRKEARLTQAQTATIIGVTASHYPKIEAGKNEPNLSLIRLFSREFYVNEEWMLKGTGEKHLRVKEAVEAAKEKSLHVTASGYGNSSDSRKPAVLRERPAVYGRPAWRNRLEAIVAEQEKTISQATEELGVSYETILAGIGRRLDAELKRREEPK